MNQTVYNSASAGIILEELGPVGGARLARASRVTSYIDQLFKIRSDAAFLPLQAVAKARASSAKYF